MWECVCVCSGAEVGISTDLSTSLKNHLVIILYNAVQTHNESPREVECTCVFM